MRVLLVIVVLAALGYLAFGHIDLSLRDVAPSSPAESEANARPADLELAGTRRASLELRWRKARSIAVEKWRADVLTANVLGEIGARPPMLHVHETGSEVRVTNRSTGPVCVSMARITRPNTDAVQRCEVGPAHCSLIKPGATIGLKAKRTDMQDGCLHAVLEYRVGTVDFPEPTWWSRTAFNAFSDPPMDIGYKDAADLHADIARFEATVAETDRAARWRRGLLNQ